MKTQIPLIPNTPEPNDWRCVLACVRMILQCFTPEKDLPWKELDSIARYEQGKGVWFPPVLLYLNDVGYAIKNIEDFDYARAAREGCDYLREWNPQNWEWYCNQSNYLKVLDTFDRFAAYTEIRDPIENDLKQALNEKKICIVEVDWASLYGEEGFHPHAVLIYGYDELGVWIQDPGLPPRAEQYVPWERFKKSWADNVTIVSYPA